MSSDEDSLLQEPFPETARRVSGLSLASSSSESDFERDEAGLITSNKFPSNAVNASYASSAQQAETGNASTVIKALDMEDSNEDEEEAVLTPKDVNRPTANVPRKPGRAQLTTSNTSSGKGSLAPNSTRQNLTLREQEKLIDQVKKENFSLKLKIFFLEERLAKLAPDHIDAALKENIELKVNFQTCQQELKKHKRMCLDLNKVVESLQADLKAALAGSTSTPRPSTDDHSELQREIARLKAELSRAWASEKGSTRWPNAEDARAEINRLRDELDAEREEKERILSRQGLNSNLRSASRASQASSSTLREDYHSLAPTDNKKLQDLKADNASLLSQINAQVTMLSTRNSEKEALLEELESVKNAHSDLEAQFALLQSRNKHPPSRNLVEKSTRRSASEEGSETSSRVADLEDELLAYRDKFSAISLEMERREAEIEDLLQDGDLRDQEHLQQLSKVQEEWSKRMGELKLERDELNDLLADREDEVKELAQKLEEFSQLVDAKDGEIDSLNEELDALTEDLKKLGNRVYSLEEELADKEDAIANMNGDMQDLEDSTSRHSHVASALKEKVTSLKTQVSTMNTEQESLLRERTHLRERLEEMATSAATAEERIRSEAQQRRSLEDELEAALDREATKAKELRNATEKLAAKEADFAKVQRSLKDAKTDSTDRVVLEVEIERLRRDLKRAERDADDALSKASDASLKLTNLISENKNLNAKLESAQTARLGLSEKLDATSKDLNHVKKELTHARTQSASSEKAMSRSSSLNKLDKDQLVERNSLLSEVYQTVDKALATATSSPRKEVKPQNNFGIFQDLLLSRLKRFLALKENVDRQLNESQRKWESKYSHLKSTQDSRMRQLDRFENALKNAQDAQKAWKAKLVLKASEIESHKSTINELQTQIGSLKTRMPSSDGPENSVGLHAKLSSAQSLASSYQRRLAQTQAQLEDAEAKLEEGRAKVGRAEEKWEFRLRELEARLRAAEEGTKRAKQGGKERVRELNNHIDFLEKELRGSERRGKTVESLTARQRPQSSLSNERA